jgi:tetratricopeptide (TPR) repeat protein
LTAYGIGFRVDFKTIFRSWEPREQMAQSGSPNSTKSFADAILLDDLQSYLRQQEEDPGNHLAPYQAGLIYARLGQFEEAVRSYQRAIERFPEFEQAYYNLGAAYSTLERYSEAEQAYHKATALDGADSEAWANLGAVQEAQGRLDDALACFAKAVSLEPAEAEAQLRMARIHLQRGDYTAAREVCEAALERFPESPEAWNDLGLVHFHEGQRAGAEGCYRKALQFREDYAQAWCNLGTVLAATGNEHDAEGAYRTALNCDERDADLWFNLGEFYFQRGHHDTERCLWQAVELNRRDLEAWDLLRRWYQGHANPQRLHAVLRVLTLSRPDDRELLAELARAAEMERDFAQASESYRKLLALNPDDEFAQLGLVRVHLKEGQLLEAYRHLRDVVAATPEVVDQWIHLGHRLRYRGRREEAEDCFRRALEHRPTEPELAHYLGEIAMERKEWAAAFDWFSRAGEMNRNDRHVWIPLMRQFYAEQDYARAAACLDHLDELAQYLPGLWIEFDEVYDNAGRREELLAKVERWLELGMVGSAHWTELADLYERAGQPERAAALRARATAAPTVTPTGAREYLEVQRAAPELPVEAESAPGQPASEPSDPEYWIEQGESHFQQGRLDEALASLNRAVTLDIPRFRAWFRIGGLFYLIGRLDEAEVAFGKATALNAEEAKGWYNLGVCQAEQGRLAPARGSFERTLALDRRFAKAWDWLGLLHFDAGMHAQARRCFVRCLAVSRDSANAWHNLGMLYRAMGRNEESAHCLAQAGRLGGVEEQQTINRLRAGKPGARSLP